MRIVTMIFFAAVFAAGVAAGAKADPGAIPFQTDKAVSFGTAVGGSNLDNSSDGDSVDWSLGVNVSVYDALDLRVVGTRSFDISKKTSDSGDAWRGWVGVAIGF